MTYWQVQAGDGNRDYSDVFLKYGVMLLGPGNPGSYFEKKEYYDKEYGHHDIPSFAERVKEGDIVVLKRPAGQVKEVVAAGYVRGSYQYKEVFDDVEGWNLQHCWYVDWKQPRRPTKTEGFARGAFSEIHQDSPKKVAKRVLKTGTSVPPGTIPKSPRKLTDEALIDFLISDGLRIKDAEDFTSTIHRIRRLIKWYRKCRVTISEHETRTFLIIPLLLSLGWTEQQLKIEWKKTDVAFFKAPYTEDTEPKDCIIILESKKLWGGLIFGESQAARFANSFSNCDRFIVSDGCIYKLYKRDKRLLAYLNILLPKQKHPYDPTVGGAQDVFLNLMKR